MRRWNMPGNSASHRAAITATRRAVHRPLRSLGLEFFAGNDLHRRSRSVMAGQPAWRRRGVSRRITERATQHRLDLLRRDGAWPQERRLVRGEIDNRRLQPDFARPTLQHEFHAVAKFLVNVLARRGADAAKAIRRGRSQSAAERFQHLLGDGMRRTRRPIVGSPPVTACAALSLRLRISVSGPGQNASANRAAPLGISIAQSRI